eukprot:CAMPEP_0177403080 /NCGR_PEP_ID=MMETSP0368-20130122/60620_1 /TAXON_ID=447022 ORGANISM="Scrippsiella hangoei-like, Strain SHHI-4" /NCGR_SAMPLE_ID=MMETSP0368 /ASSEMBLY_ACC=CAM_ASM_000363 /LENGTH=186 /DNA_ID=CAMNT_0018870959 /DNA_START=24 /DNA_END=581 /DNA_ORIENTATION=+
MSGMDSPDKAAAYDAGHGVRHGKHVQLGGQELGVGAGGQLACDLLLLVPDQLVGVQQADLESVQVPLLPAVQEPQDAILIDDVTTHIVATSGHVQDHRGALGGLAVAQQLLCDLPPGREPSARLEFLLLADGINLGLHRVQLELVFLILVPLEFEAVRAIGHTEAARGAPGHRATLGAAARGRGLG